MKKIYLTLLLFLCTLHLKGQTGPVPNVGSYTNPLSLNLCEVNSDFNIRNIMPTGLNGGVWPSSFTLSLRVFVVNNPTVPGYPLSIPYPWSSPNNFPDCYAGFVGDNPVNSLATTPCGGTPATPTWDLANNSWQWTISCLGGLSDPIENLPYSIDLDCSLLSLINTGSLYLVQQWFYNGNPLPLQPAIPIPIKYPHYVPVISNGQFFTASAPLGQTVDWFFIYQNNGPGPIMNPNIPPPPLPITSFDFNLTNCSYIDIINEEYYIETTSTLPPAGSPTTSNDVWVNPGDYLIIKITATITGCVPNCNLVNAEFRWRCSNPDNDDCDNCQYEVQATQVVFNAGNENYTITREAPAAHIALHNTACQGETTHWQFKVQNTGNATLKETIVTFTDPTSGSQPLSNVHNVVVTDANSCTSGFGCANLDPGYPLISTCPGNYISDFVVNIFDLLPGEFVLIDYDEYHCCSQDITLLNAPKYFNQWLISSTSESVCGYVLYPDDNPIIPNQAIYAAESGVSSYSSISGNPDLNLVLDFTPTLFDITVYPPPCPNPVPPPCPIILPYFGTSPVFLEIGFDGMFANTDDFQALGFSINPPSPLSGIIKVEIDCEIGLGIQNPSDVFFVVEDNTGTEINFNPLYVPTFTHNCSAQVFTFYFRLSDLLGLNVGIAEFFSTAELHYGITACCNGQDTPDNYKIIFSLLRNETCFDFASGNCSADPAHTSANCCWLPLSSREHDIFVHCPGCLAPGAIVDNYSIFRTTLGFSDLNNNSRVDGGLIVYKPGQLANAPPVYDEYDELRLEKSVYGDELLDYTIAHFQDGFDDGLGGYTYQQMLDNEDVLGNSQPINLDVLQLYREIPFSGADDFNLQIIGFDLFIDDPNWLNPANPDCKECDHFDASVQMNYPTVLHLNFVFANFTGTNPFFNRGVSPTDDHRYLFTFNESDLVYYYNNLTPGIDINLEGNWQNSNIDFKKNQQYRLRVQYKVCGNIHEVTVNPTLAQLQKQAIINNFVWLRGVAVPFANISSYGSITAQQMPNGANLELETQASLGDAFNFYCEPRAGGHYFLSTDMVNYTTYGIDNAVSGCFGNITIKAINSFARNWWYPQNFDFEIKPPRIFPQSFDITPPDGWSFNTLSNNLEVDVTSYSTHMSNNTPIESFSLPNITDPHAPITFDLLDLTFTCLDDILPSDNFLRDELSLQLISIPIVIDECPDTPILQLPAAVNSNYSKITFAENQTQCSLANSLCGINYEQNNMREPVFSSLLLPNPDLTSIIYPAVYNANNSTVRWHFELRNFVSPALPYQTAANNVFISIPQILNLSNWSINYERKEITPGSLPIDQFQISAQPGDNYFWMTPATPISPPASPDLINLPIGQYFEGDITATMDPCASPINFDFNWGWNCTQESIYPSVEPLCNVTATPIEVVGVPGNLTAFNHFYTPNEYTACSGPIVVQVCFKNLLQVEVIPENLEIIFNQNVTVDNLTMTPCAGTPMSITWTPSGVPNNWDINTGNYYIKENECFCINFEVTVDCNIGPLQMPVLLITGKDFCDNDFDSDYALPSMYPAEPPLNPSFCDNCYEIYKIGYPNSVTVGETVTFEIDICGNNATPSVVDLLETFPANFVPFPAVNFPMQANIPASGCTTVTVSGIFIDAGICDVNNNIATIEFGSSGNSLSAEACVQVSCPSGIAIQGPITSTAYWMGLNPPPGSTYSLTGELIIDNNITFDNCTLIVAPDGFITVNPLVTLTTQTNTLIYGCPNMWQGIVLQTNSNISVTRTTIRDAAIGIHVNDRCTYHVDASNFFDCIAGIFVEPNINGNLNNVTGQIWASSFGGVLPQLKAPYPGQAMPIGLTGRAGVILHDVSGLFVGDNNQSQNEFFKINNGIEIYNSTVTATNNRYVDIIADPAYGVSRIPSGVAVFARSTNDKINTVRVSTLASGAMTITNSNVGVFNMAINALISGVKMTNVNSGVYSLTNRKRSTYVNGCDITANRFGIDWRNNDGANAMSAIANTITVATRDAIGIRMTELSTASSQNFQLNGNFIYTNSAHCGIQSNNVNNALIEQNQIFQEQINAADEFDMFGVQLNGCEKNAINCNRVSNVNATSLFTFGYHVNQSTNSKINCNDAAENTIGVFFGAQCGGTKFSGNTMENNQIRGLQLNSNAEISPQVQAGNRFIGNYGPNLNNPDGADNRNNTGQGLQASRFDTHSNMSDPDANNPNMYFFPKVPLDNFSNTNLNVPVYNAQGTSTSQTDWFNPDLTQSPFLCQNTTLCNVQIAGGGDDRYERMIATDSTETVDYKPESKNVAQQYLYEKLFVDSSFMNSDSIYVEFYNSHETNAIGKLQEVKHNMNAAHQDSILMELILYTDSLLVIKNEEIKQIDSIAFANPTVDYSLNRQLILDEIDDLQQDVRNIKSQRDSIANSILSASEQINNSVNSTKIPEENQKQVNETIINVQLNDPDSLNNLISAMLSIAHQCPYSGGKAVYQARAFISKYYSDSIIYDDKNVCLSEGIYRQSINNSATKKTQRNFIIVPNPAKDYFEIHILETFEGNCIIEMFDSMNRLLKKENINCVSKIHRFDSAHLQPGVYSIRLTSNQKDNYTSKLVIVK